MRWLRTFDINFLGFSVRVGQEHHCNGLWIAEPPGVLSNYLISSLCKLVKGKAPDL
ncbi:hypothetical protein B0H12DRAFT_1113262 [Mycena haematopus]|nr:hypothetical protein B0H12DRAFT_1113262 [Mycena haematopus]